MAHLALAFLGHPAIHLNGTEVLIGRTKALALLAYLAVTQQRQSRAHLAALFWPEDNDRTAHTYLRNMLWTLTHALGKQWFTITRTTVVLPSQPELWVDVHQLQAQLARRPLDPHTVLALCRGDFLADFAVSEAPAFAEWQRQQGAAWRVVQGEALARVVQAQMAANAIADAIATTERWLSLDPLDEVAHCQLMRLYDLSGQWVRALRHYEDCVHLFQRKLGQPPSSTVTVLYQRMLRQSPTVAQPGTNSRQAWEQEAAGQGNYRQQRAAGDLSRPPRVVGFHVVCSQSLGKGKGMGRNRVVANGHAASNWNIGRARTGGDAGAAAGRGAGRSAEAGGVASWSALSSQQH